MLKLFPKPRAQATAMAALATPRDAVELLAHVQAALRRSAHRLRAARRAICLDLVRKHFPRVPAPLAAGYPQYVLVELSDTQGGPGAGALLEATLGEAIEAGLALDAVVAASVDAGKEPLGAARERLRSAGGGRAEHQARHLGPDLAHRRVHRDAPTRGSRARFPGIRMVAFGHVGDGNLHYNSLQPEGGDAKPISSREPPDVNRVVYDSVAELGGSISAEHGLGQFKRDEIVRYKSRGGARADARRQARARSARDHESGEGPLIG